MTADLVIGCGAGFAGDRFDAALPVLETLATYDCPRYLIYEVLAERTLAIAQKQKLAEPTQGYSPYLHQYLGESLTRAKELGVTIVTNMGAANPVAAAKEVLKIADVRVAVVLGDDLLENFTSDWLIEQPTIEGLAIKPPLVAANAYLGGRAVAKALATNADVVLVGRTTDIALSLGPMIHHFGWSEDDLDQLALGSVVGHLLECGGQVTGAYFADPPMKVVPDLANVGFPIAEVTKAGDAIITKAANTGGLVDRATVTEQLLYEVHDPANYLTPDVAVDLSGTQLEEAGPDRIAISGVKGNPPPNTLKATLCTDSGYLAEASMVYAGYGAASRARLASEVISTRCAMLDLDCRLRVEVVGLGAALDSDSGSRPSQQTAQPIDGEYQVRLAAFGEQEIVQRASDELLSLYCSGPSAGGGVRQSISQQLETASILIDRNLVEPHVRVQEFSR